MRFFPLSFLSPLFLTLFRFGKSIPLVKGNCHIVTMSLSSHIESFEDKINPNVLRDFLSKAQTSIMLRSRSPRVTCLCDPECKFCRAHKILTRQNSFCVQKLLKLSTVHTYFWCENNSYCVNYAWNLSIKIYYTESWPTNLI